MTDLAKKLTLAERMKELAIKLRRMGKINLAIDIVGFIHEVEAEEAQRKELTELWIHRLEEWRQIAKDHHKEGLVSCLIVHDVNRLLPRLKVELEAEE